MAKQLEAIGEIGRVLKQEWRTLVETSIPKILIHILPLFAISKEGEMAAERHVQKRISRANAGYDVLTKIVKQEVSHVWLR